MTPLIGLVILVIAIVTILDIFKNLATASGKKILWILLVLFLPLIGAALWFLVGKKKGV